MKYTSQRGKSLVLRQLIENMSKDKRSQFMQNMPELYRDVIRQTIMGKSQTQIAIDERRNQSEISKITRTLVGAVKAFRFGGRVTTTTGGRFKLIKPLPGAKENMSEKMEPIPQFIDKKDPHASIFDAPELPEEELELLTRPASEAGEMLLSEFIKKNNLEKEYKKATHEELPKQEEKEKLPTTTQFDNLDLDALSNAILERIAEKMAKKITKKIVRWFT